MKPFRPFVSKVTKTMIEIYWINAHNYRFAELSWSWLAIKQDQVRIKKFFLHLCHLCLPAHFTFLTRGDFYASKNKPANCILKTYHIIHYKFKLIFLHIWRRFFNPNNSWLVCNVNLDRFLGGLRRYITRENQYTGMGWTVLQIRWLKNQFVGIWWTNTHSICFWYI